MTPSHGFTRLVGKPGLAAAAFAWGGGFVSGAAPLERVWMSVATG